MTELELQARLRDLLDRALREASVEVRGADMSPKGGACDFALRVGPAKSPYRLVVACKGDGQPRFVLQALGHLLTHKRAPDDYPVVAAPRIGPRSAELCRQADVGYIDLDGNCRLKFGQVLISKQVARQPREERREIRSIFSPKSSRVSRAMLHEPLRVWSQSELAKTCRLCVSHVNGVIRRMTGQEFVVREGRKSFRLKDRDALLETWKREYDFNAHAAHAYYTPLDFEQFVPRLHLACDEHGWRYALTMFAGAYYVAPHVRFNRIHAYFEGDILKLKDVMDLKSVPTGANVVLIHPKDAGVFDYPMPIPEVHVVSDVQLQLDLASSEARGKQAAAFLQGVPLSAWIPRLVPEQEARLHEFLKLRDEGDTRFRSGRYAEACDTFRKALLKAENLPGQDVEVQRKRMTITWWLAALRRAYRERSVAPLDEACRIYTGHDIEACEEAVDFDPIQMQLGYFLRVALEARRPSCADRPTRESEARHWHKAVTARFIVGRRASEVTAAARGEADEIMAWFRTGEPLKE